MPTLDQCHQQIVNALLKAGWSVDPGPYFARQVGITILADIRARQSNGFARQIIIVEVKRFPDSASDQDELYRASG
jgi:hypothetical protein